MSTPCPPPGTKKTPGSSCSVIPLYRQEASPHPTQNHPPNTAANNDGLPTNSSYQLHIEDMHCAGCVARVEAIIRAVVEVREVAINLVDKTAQVLCADPDAVIAALVAGGYGASRVDLPCIDTFFIQLDAMPDTVEKAQEEAKMQHIRALLLKEDETAQIYIEGTRLRLTTQQHPADALLRLTASGIQAHIEEHFVDPTLSQVTETQQQIRFAWQRAFVAGLTGATLMIGHMSGAFPHLHEGRLFWAGAAAFCLGVLIFAGRNTFTGAWRQARHGAANMDTLIAFGIGVAWLSSLLLIINPALLPDADANLHLDASVMILAFLQIGHALETKAKRTSSEAIGALAGLRAQSALLIRPTGQINLPVSLLRRGDQVRVKPGERVPIDGEIIEGHSTIDESMLSGEPLPVVRNIGDSVTGGTMNRSGSFVLRVTRFGEETTLAQIIHMVSAAQMSKAPIGRLADRIAAVFVPVVVGISLVSACIWLGFGPEPRLAHALTAAIAVLVIACPCALGLATPIAIMVGTSRAAQCQVLIRNSEALQTAATLSHIVLDKTGTLTRGRFEVSAILPAQGADAEDVLFWAASLEKNSEHPLAEAIITAQQEQGKVLAQLDQFTVLSGRGIQAEHQGTPYLLGNQRLLTEQQLILPADLLVVAEEQAQQGASPVWLARAQEVLGVLILKDSVRQEAKDAVTALQQAGITVLICSGDKQASVDAVAHAVGIHDARGELLPADKLRVIQSLQQQGYKVGMVGDGINDAPALAQADTGFALGSGTDIAMHNADITLTGTSLMLLADAIAISRASIRTIKYNLFGAFIYNVMGIPLAAGALYPCTGWLLDPMFASAAMALSSVTVVVNANRLRFFRPRPS